MIVLDTHAWIWWVSSPRLLSEKAIKAIDRAVAERSVYISSISAWEVVMLVERGRLQLTIDVKDWIYACEAFPFVTFVPVNNNIAIKAVRLPGKIHSDPADRIIISTAISLGAVLITMDEKLLNYTHVKSVW